MLPTKSTVWMSCYVRCLNPRRASSVLPVLILALSLTTWGWAAPQWNVLEEKNFTVLSQLSEKTTRRWANEFNQFTVSLGGILRIQEKYLPRLTVVLFAREKSFRPYLPVRSDGKPIEIAGCFVFGETWSVIGLTENFEDEENRRLIFHEGVHWLERASSQSNPLWLSEGLAEVYSTFEVVKDQAKLGKVIDGHVIFLRDQPPPLSLAQLVTATHEGELLDKNSGIDVFYAESWLFVHYLFFGEHTEKRNGLADYVQACAAGKNLEEAFRGAFGASFVEMDKELKRYLDSGEFRYRLAPLANLEKGSTVFSKATPGFVDASLAWLAIGMGHFDLARKHADAAIKIAPESAMAYDALAAVLAEGDQHDGLLNACEKAEQLGSKEPWTLVLLARERMRVARELGGVLHPEARRVADLYKKAIHLRPNLRKAYRGLSEVLAFAEKVTTDDWMVLGSGRKYYPNDSVLKINIARLGYENGRKAEAKKLMLSAIEHPEALDREIVDSARSELMRWEYKETASHVEKLIEEEKFGEAVKGVDQLLAMNQPPDIRSQLLRKRGTLVAHERYQAGLAAVRERRLADAKELFEQLLAGSNTPPLLKRRAEERLKVLKPAPAVTP